MKVEYEIKFPCGYELKLRVTAWSVSFNDDAVFTDCPLHGKDCNKLSIKPKQKQTKQRRRSR